MSKRIYIIDFISKFSYSPEYNLSFDSFKDLEFD